MLSNVGFLRLKALMERGYAPNWAASYGSDMELVHPLSSFLIISADGGIWQSATNLYIEPSEAEKFQSFVISIREPSFFDRIEFYTKIKLILAINLVALAAGALIGIFFYYGSASSADFVKTSFSSILAVSPLTLIIAMVPPTWRRSNSWFR